jgi:DNA transformation protein
MAVSNDYLDYVTEQLSEFGEITIRKMFGGAGLYFDELIFGLPV